MYSDGTPLSHALLLDLSRYCWKPGCGNKKYDLESSRKRARFLLKGSVFPKRRRDMRISANAAINESKVSSVNAEMSRRCALSASTPKTSSRARSRSGSSMKSSIASNGSGVTAFQRDSNGAPPDVRKKEPFLIRFVIQDCLFSLLENRPHLKWSRLRMVRLLRAGANILARRISRPSFTLPIFERDFRL